MRSARTSARSGWGHGPSWGFLVFILFVLGLLTASLGFDSAMYAEYGARIVEKAGYQYPRALDELEGDPAPLVTVTLRDGRVYSFATQQGADQWMDRLAAERELPAVRSKLASIGGRLFLAGAGFIAVSLGLGIWWAVTGSARRRDRVRGGDAVVGPGA
jgi:hypothetical protein